MKQPKNITIGLQMKLELNQPIEELEELLEGMKRIRNKQKHTARRCINCESLESLLCMNDKIVEIFGYDALRFIDIEKTKEFLCPYFKFASDKELEKRYENKEEKEKTLEV